MERNIIWALVEEPGMEHLRLTVNDGQIVADGVIVGVTENQPFRVHYKIRCDAEWRVREADIRLLDGVGQNIKLNADGKGHWTDGSGNHVLSLNGCLEVDISATPFTNTLAIRRTRLQPGESADLVAAFIAVPEMVVTPSRQRYTCVDLRSDGGLYKYEDEGLFQGFTADLSVDADGLVVEYPELFKRVWAA
jgi:uncharacterized protein